jgi:membrane associated rhomboid family serine protease
MRPPSRAVRLLLTLQLLAFVLSWALRASGFAWVNAAYGMVPARLSADPLGEASKLLSGLFIHDGLGHLTWNLIFLLLFGRRVERTLGYARFLAFFFITGVSSSLSQFAIDPQSSIPLVGSSGAIAGLLAGFLVLFPRQPITIFAWPAYGVIGFWFVMNLIGGLASLGGGTSDTAFFAHLGGFLAGLLLIRPFTKSDEDEPKASPFGSSARVIRRPIFPKDADGPFWRGL